MRKVVSDRLNILEKDIIKDYSGESLYKNILIPKRTLKNFFNKKEEYYYLILTDEEVLIYKLDCEYEIIEKLRLEPREIEEVNFNFAIIENIEIKIKTEKVSNISLKIKDNEYKKIHRALERLNIVYKLDLYKRW